MTRLAIADPPYLGRASLWYGGKGRSKQGAVGRACGRGNLSAEYHPDAAMWDIPETHNALIEQMEAEFDGWALAASSKTLHLLRYPSSARVAIWHVTNAIPDGSRIHNKWEAVIVRTPRDRRGRASGAAVPDVLSAGHPVSGHVGAKPRAWTLWVLDLLGFQPDDEIVDLFPGSGAVSHAAGVLF